ncbi:MAG: hypothetical protein IPK13_16480 [Deltaproteobacteria bacterium]|nr:hypothetical protein [Deltaproteobacteria bacterium]
MRADLFARRRGLGAGMPHAGVSIGLMATLSAALSAALLLGGRREAEAVPAPAPTGTASGVAAAGQAAASTAGDDRRWYAHPDCLRAQGEVVGRDATQAMAAIQALEKSPSVELQACAHWLMIPFGVNELVFQGKSPALHLRTEARLEALFRFAMKHAREYPHLRDLAIEARMRRVRLLIEMKERDRAVKEAKLVEKMLASRAASPQTPSWQYARGATDLAIGSTSWPLRVLASAAGIKGDAERGYRLLNGLKATNTVYRAEALDVLHFFAEQDEEKPSARTLALVAERARALPKSAYYALDLAESWAALGRWDEAEQALASVRGVLAESPDAWSPRLRRRIYYVMARCAAEREDFATAQAELSRASKEQWGGYAEMIAALQVELDRNRVTEHATGTD